ncbi:MAG: Uma2 family endonuclease [Myxococcota bacterium]
MRPGLPGRRTSSTARRPDIVVEVVSSSPRDGGRDRVAKKRDYAALGVGQYWLVDPELRTVEVLARGDDGRFIEVLAASDGTHAVPGHADLQLDLDALWADLDRWPEEGPPA